MNTNQLKLIPGLLIIALLLTSFMWIGPKQLNNKEILIPKVVSEDVLIETLSVDSEAIEILRRGLDFLSGLSKFSVQTQSTYEDLLYENYRVDYETSNRITVNRPDKIRIERYGLKMHQIFYFDGKDFTLNNPYDNVYATEPISGDIEDMFHIARDSHGISGPASDLIYKNSFFLLSQDLKSATIIGKEMIGDIMCDHLFFDRNDGVSFQIWISESAPYLPYKYVVTDTSTPNLLSFGIVMSNWDTDPKITDKMFQFTPTKDLKKIMFLKIDPNKE